jgi:hypothetical protein
MFKWWCSGMASRLCEVVFDLRLLNITFQAEKWPPGFYSNSSQPFLAIRIISEEGFSTLYQLLKQAMPHSRLGKFKSKTL